MLGEAERAVLAHPDAVAEAVALDDEATRGVRAGRERPGRPPSVSKRDAAIRRMLGAERGQGEGVAVLSSVGIGRCLRRSSQSG